MATKNMTLGTDSNPVNLNLVASAYLKLYKLYTYSSSDKSSLGYGSSGQTLMSDGTNCYWGTPPATINFDDIYPVGSIYMSVNSTDPGTLFGGTWEQIEDKFLLAAGSTYSAGKSGGTSTHSHNLDQAYSTAFAKFNAIGSTMWYSRYTGMPNAYSTTSKITASSYQNTTVSHSDAIGLGGSTQVVSNMPPYLTVYVWKRTA